MSVDGDWKVTMKSPMGARDATLTLNSDGGSLSGQMAGPQGTQKFDGGTIDGDALAWKISMTKPMPMKLKFEATVDGDTIKGKVEFGSFGDASFEGSRA